MDGWGRGLQYETDNKQCYDNEARKRMNKRSARVSAGLASCDVL